MARASKGSSSNTSSGKPRKAKPKKPRPALETVVELPPDADGSTPLADRYYELAETMNARGAIELAVPFYRQALALLMEERQQWHQLLPEASSSEQAQLPGSAIDLEVRLAELGEELTPDSARQVLVGLEELLTLSGAEEMPALGYSLRGKALLLLGDVALAVDAFEAACDAAPEDPAHTLNLAAALIIRQQVPEALALLRPLYAHGLAVLPEALRETLLRNLATAERQAGEPLAALQLRRQWLQLNPEAVPLERWLQWAATGLEQERGDPCRLEALALLQDLHRLRPQQRLVKEALAEALEAEGDYRQAALLYRDLLRP